MTQLVDRINLGSARGGKRQESSPLTCEVVRELTEEDLPVLREPPRVGGATQQLTKVHHSHHQLARMLAQGMEAVAASAATGYSQSYISLILNHDPAFAELVAYYASEREAVFVDTLERMKSVGVDSLEKLHQRLLDENIEWSNRELMEAVKLLLVEPQRSGANVGAGAGAGSAAGVTVNVKFVQGGPEGSSGPLIDTAAPELEMEDLPSGSR